MLEVWVNLAPLILASAVLPLQTVLTLQLARSSTAAACAWVAGMTAARIIQGFLFGFVFLLSAEHRESGSPRIILGSILLLLALLLYVKAMRTAFGAEDEDAPPPGWLTKAGSMSPLAAFGAGAGFMTVSAKFLVFTLAAISAIGEAQMSTQASVLIFVLFVLLAAIVPIMILTLSGSSSNWSAAILSGFSAWLQRHRRGITILFGVVFGTWFLLKALKQLRLF